MKKIISIWKWNWDWEKILTGVSGAALLVGLFFSWVMKDPVSAGIFYYISIFLGGYFVFAGAVKGILKQRFLNINFLVVVAAMGAVYINQLGEAAAVVFFFSLAEAFEEFGIERSRRAVETLLKKSPQTAILESGEEVPVEKVKVGDIVIVRPGDLIPMDGKIVKGFSSVDEAAITGESIPKDKHEGDTVFAGTLNRNGYLEIETAKESGNSTFSKIIKMVKAAQKSRASSQTFIDIFAKYYTPSVVVGAALIASVPPLFFGGVFSDWMYRALVLLVISCPCALVISTPVSIASAIGGASRKGVLVKGGKYLELLGKIKAVAFDKTRTLTLGEPYISDIAVFNGFSEEDVIADAAGIEKFSSHPLSKSILDFAQKNGITAHLMDKYEHVAGKGGKATCSVCNDIEHCIGNLKLIQPDGKLESEAFEKTEKFEKEGKTVVLVNEGGKLMGALAISDRLRPEAALAVGKLARMGVDSVILTGDNPRAADFVARETGIKEVYASLLPDEKLQQIEKLKKKFTFVAMVGDGVNDAPSLVASTVGIAMAVGGSDVAIETADVALMNGNLLNIPYMIKLGKKSLKTIKWNIGAALAVKVVFLVGAVFGFPFARLEYAIGADSGIAILVILNSLRMFNVK